MTHVDSIDRNRERDHSTDFIADHTCNVDGKSGLERLVCDACEQARRQQILQ